MSTKKDTSLYEVIKYIVSRTTETDAYAKELRNPVTEDRKREILNGIHLNCLSIEKKILGRKH
jgi:hypothetical protein